MNNKILLSIVIVLVLGFGIFFVSASHDRDMENEYETAKLGGSAYRILQEPKTDVQANDKPVINSYVQRVIKTNDYDYNYNEASPCNSKLNNCNQPAQENYVPRYDYNQPITICNPQTNDCQPIQQERYTPCYNSINQEKGVPCYSGIPQEKKNCRNKVIDNCGNIMYSDDSCEYEIAQEKGDGKLVTPAQTSSVPCSYGILQEKDIKTCYYD